MHGSQPKLRWLLSSRFWFATTISMVAWESSQNLETPPLVSPQMTFGNDCSNFILAMSCVTTQIWVVLLIVIFPRHTTNQKHHPELGNGTSTVRNFCSHFSDVISQGNHWWCYEMSAVFSGYLTVVQFSWCKVAMQLGVAMWVGTGLNADPSSCSFPKAPFLWRQVVMGRRDISLQNVVNCLREKQKVGLA